MTRFALILDLRAQCYFWIATGTAFLAQTENVTQLSDWSTMQWARTGIASAIAGMTAVRAYIDQSISNRSQPLSQPPS